MGKEVVEIAGAAATAMESALDSMDPVLSVAWMLKMGVPGVVGVPVMAPVPVLRLSPPGSDPLFINQVMGAVPPDAPTIWEYAALTVPPGSDIVEIVSFAAASMVSSCVSNVLLESMASMVKLGEPEAVGVPVISPVTGLRLRPSGSEPAVTIHV